MVEVGIAENSTYFFDANNPEGYTFEEIKPILIAKMDKEPLKNLKITGDKVANYEAVFMVNACGVKPHKASHQKRNATDKIGILVL